MKTKIVILGLIFFGFMVAKANSQTIGAFYGYVKYNGPCECAPEHQVKIQKDGGIADYHRIKCAGENTGYSSDPYSYTAGWYNISVMGLTGNCTNAVQRVYYDGTGSMEVDLEIFGPDQRPPSGP